MAIEREHGLDDIIGDKGRPPQDGPRWYEDYSELKATETLWAQEKLLSLS